MKVTNSNTAQAKQRVIRRVRSTLLNQEIDMDFTNVSYVVGTRALVTPWSTERRCALCDHPVYTSLIYPEDVSILCEQCSGALPEQDS
jgi:hypothetical protein